MMARTNREFGNACQSKDDGSVADPALKIGDKRLIITRLVQNHPSKLIPKEAVQFVPDLLVPYPGNGSRKRGRPSEKSGQEACTDYGSCRQGKANE